MYDVNLTKVAEYIRKSIEKPPEKIEVKSVAHVCTGCWAGYWVGGNKYMCLFTAGSCVKNPSTILEPVYEFYQPIVEVKTKAGTFQQKPIKGIKELAAEHGLDESLVRIRIRMGWTLGEALKTPKGCIRRRISAEYEQSAEESRKEKSTQEADLA